MSVAEVERPPDLRAAALALASKGFRVFPLIEDSNTPTAEKFYDRATASPELVEETWTQAVTDEPAHYNIGIETGREILVVDIDVKKGKQGRQDFAYLDLQGLDSSVMASTPSGGFHVYLRLPEGVTVGSRLGTLQIGNYVCKGTDVKGWHGYVVGPGSETARGRYIWKSEPRSLDDIPYAPDWLIEAIGKPTERSADADEPPPMGWDRPEDEKRAIHYLCEEAPEAIEGSFGDKTTFGVACNLRELGISRARALDLMLKHWNKQKAFPPWMPEDLDEKVRNAYHYAKKRAGEFQCYGFDAYDMPEGADVAPAIQIVDDTAAAPPPSVSAPTDFPAPSAPTRTTIEPAANDNGAVPDALRPKDAVAKFGNLNLETMAEAAAAAQSRNANWLVKDLLDLGAAAVMFGGPNTGKSFVAIELAGCVAEGRPFAGFPVRHGAVLYVVLEGTAGFRWRVTAYQKHRCQKPDAPFVMASGSIDLFSQKKATFDVVRAAGAVAEKFGLPVNLIIIDTLAKAMGPGVENDTSDMNVMAARADQIARETGACVVLVHHTGKDVSKGARGALSLKASVDTEIEIRGDKRIPGTPASGLIIPGKERDNDYFRHIRFVLRQVVAGVTADLENKTSCIVDFPIKREAPEEELSPLQRVALDALRSITPNGEAVTAKAWDEAMSNLTEKRGLPPQTTKARAKYRVRLRDDGFVTLDAARKWRPNLETFGDVST